MSRSTAPETGNVEYGRRAFHQDAMEAMRGDIVRGIIELVTNSDDAYAKLGDGRVGKVSIEVEHRRNQASKLVVRDRATGMRSVDLRDRITKLGQRTSGFEQGLEVRGNLGRGAKDVAAFGDVRFQSICDGRYSELSLTTNGSWTLQPERDATDSDRNVLGIKGTGTVVTVHVAASVRVPQHRNLRVRLATHYQLRKILSDPARKVELVNLNNGDTEKLSYTFPRLPVAFEGDIEIPGYPAASTAHMVIWRHSERCDEVASDPGRPTGILIQGRRAVYDNTLFSFEGNVHAGWFSGLLTCPYIDALAQEYDGRMERGEPHPTSNPQPIISRRRDGLILEHPFVKVLREAAERPLAKLVAAEAEKARSDGGVETDKTRAALDRVARELARLIAEELREIEADEPPGPEEGLPPLLSLIPEQVIAYMGEDRTLTVAARSDNVSIGDTVQVDVDPTGVVELLTPSVTLQQHARREDVLVGQIRVRPILEGEATLVVATMRDRVANALVEVRPPREEFDEEIKEPESLEFERPSYRLGWQRSKDLVLRAPAEVVSKNGKRVKLISSDSGVVLRAASIELELDDAVEFYTATIPVEGRVLDAKSTLTAQVGDLVATTHVYVTRKEEGPSYRIRLDPSDMGIWRSVVETEPLPKGGEQRVIKVFTRHPALRPFVGENNEGQDSPVCRGIIAEVVADVAARQVVSELFRRRSSIEPFDADRLYREHYKRMARFLPRLQRLLVGEPSAVAQGAAVPQLDLLESST